jgi:ribose transport system permease protein
MEVEQSRTATFMPFVKVLRRVGILPFLIVILVGVFGIMNPRFVSPQNMLVVWRQMSYLGILAMGSMFPLIVSGLDLSTGNLIAFSSIVTAMTMKIGVRGVAGGPGLFSDPIMVAIGIGAGLGTASTVGLINGSIVANARVHPFVTTLGMMSILSGGSFLLSKGMAVFLLPPIFNAVLGKGEVAGVPAPILVMIGLAVGMYILMTRTHVGRYLWAIGGNISAAVISGIPIKRYITLAYVLCSLFAGITAILLAARMGSGEPLLGIPLMLQGIAAAVLGGAAIGGGRGNVPGMLLGSFFMSMLTNGMSLIEMGTFEQQIAIGCFLLVAIITDRFLQRGR